MNNMNIMRENPKTKKRPLFGNYREKSLKSLRVEISYGWVKEVLIFKNRSGNFF